MGEARANTRPMREPVTYQLDRLPEVTVDLGTPLLSRLRLGHSWIFKGEIASIRGPDGLLTSEEAVPARCRVVAGRTYIGQGILNPRSGIAVRLFTRRREQQLDEQLIRERALTALARRRPLLAGGNERTSACRLVHAEADGLPGLVVDKFGPGLVFQSLALAGEVCRDPVIAALRECLRVDWVIERNDVPIRSLEGLPERKGIWPPAAAGLPGDLVHIDEGGLGYLVDPLEGQKTGFYLDQRDNRALVRRLATQLAAGGRPIEVLDCFSYTGGFAVAAGVGAGPGGVGRLMLIDSSRPALELAGQNLQLNGLVEQAELSEANAFDWLRAAAREPGMRSRFDLVVLDPPPFAPRRSMLPGALRGYKELNLRAMRLVRPGGLLVTCTCSHHVGPEAFGRLLAEAAADAGCSFHVVAATGQPSDHPVLLSHPEGDYLRCRVLERLAG